MARDGYRIFDADTSVFAEHGCGAAEVVADAARHFGREARLEGERCLRELVDSRRANLADGR